MTATPENPAGRRSRRLVTRRGLLTGAGAIALTGVSSAAYAVGIEPQRLQVTRYALASPRWSGGPPIRIVALADLHACDPWMSLPRIRDIVARANALDPDLIVLLGDYVEALRFHPGIIDPAAWAGALAGLTAPLGVHAILGNHDWWSDPSTQKGDGEGTPRARAALERVGIPVYENDAVRLEKNGRPFWIAGLGDQIAFMPAVRAGRWPNAGLDDLPATLAKVPDGAPTILLAHEPDIFVKVPDTVALTLSGHTHGGQVRLFGYSPVVPSRYRNRYAYGLVREHTDLIVSGGLGCSILPVRFGVPPEIVLVELSAA
jgi:uncharacterized protein